MSTDQNLYKIQNFFSNGNGLMVAIKNNLGHSVKIKANCLLQHLGWRKINEKRLKQLNCLAGTQIWQGQDFNNQEIQPPACQRLEEVFRQNQKKPSTKPGRRRPR